ncbi:MAG: glycosyltransferase family 1 protein [Pseudomonadota bacterium]
MTVGVLLDATRAISRAGLGAATGIDRVERRWIEEALAGRWGAARFVARIASGLHHLDADAMSEVLAMLDGEAPAPRPDMRGALSLAKRPEARRIESAVRRCARPAATARVYANVGHANLTPESVAAARAAGASRVVVLLHDAIPLEHPEFARPDGPEKMRRRLGAAEAADAVVYNSADTRARAEARMESPPPGAVAPLGIDARKAPVPPHDGFVCLGTIEPRKNHALLLGVWARLGPGAPTLHLIGRRGWMNEEVFARLDAFPQGVIEHGALGDGEAAALIGGARALLFPSFAEGFGLPVGEALARGCPVLASDLAALREIGGEAPDYLSPRDQDGWREAVAAYAEPASPRRAAQIARIANWSAPTWADHFAAVDRVMGG